MYERFKDQVCELSRPVMMMQILIPTHINDFEGGRLWKKRFWTISPLVPPMNPPLLSTV